MAKGFGIKRRGMTSAQKATMTRNEKSIAKSGANVVGSRATGGRGGRARGSATARQLRATRVSDEKG